MLNSFFELQQLLNPLYQITLQNQITAIYLFGSYATGNEHTNSDVDLIIISDSFYGLSQYIRRKIICTQCDKLGYKIDPICMTNDDFRKYQCSIAFKEENPVLIYGGIEDETRIDKSCE